MKRREFLSAMPALGALGVAGLGLSGCGSSTPSVDLLAALDRTAQALQIFDKYLKDNGVEAAGEAEMAQFEGFLNRAMNQEPRFHDTPIAVKMQNDASFDGYADAGGDGEINGDPRLFKIEIDSENSRLIATDAQGGGTYLGMASGFLAGALLGSLLSRQRSAGVRPGSFNNRNLTPASNYTRSSARSGGLSGGK